MIGDKVWESNSRSKLFSERDDPEIDCSVLFFLKQLIAVFLIWLFLKKKVRFCPES